jgi:6,7-dimethyl-8-ribityllumazine synthase
MAQSTNSPTLLDISALKTINTPRIAVVYTEWNDAIVTEMRAGIKRIADQIGAEIVEEMPVPGSIELTFGCRALWQRYVESTQFPEAIIAVGAVIRGGTPHFDYVCQSVTQGITQLNLALPVPVVFGVLTLESDSQAWERLGGVHGHKGEEAAITSIKMIAQARRLMKNAYEERANKG